MKTLSEVGFNGIVVPDHIPRFVNSNSGNGAGTAHTVGYMKALLKAIKSENAEG